MAKKKEEEKKAASTNYKTGPPLLQSACKPFFFFFSSIPGHGGIARGRITLRGGKTTGKETAVEFTEGDTREP